MSPTLMMPSSSTCMIALAITLAGVACSPIRTELPTAVPNADFELPVGDSVRMKDSRLVVHFDMVTEDSRCPTDVQCVWAGNATVRLRLDSAGQSAVLDLKTSVPQPSTAFGRSFELRGLRPAPTSGTPVPRDRYVATLRVSS